MYVCLSSVNQICFFLDVSWIIHSHWRVAFCHCVFAWLLKTVFMCDYAEHGREQHSGNSERKSHSETSVFFSSAHQKEGAEGARRLQKSQVLFLEKSAVVQTSSEVEFITLSLLSRLNWALSMIYLNINIERIVGEAKALSLISWLSGRKNWDAKSDMEFVETCKQVFHLCNIDRLSSNAQYMFYIWQCFCIFIKRLCQ